MTVKAINLRGKSTTKTPLACHDLPTIYFDLFPWTVSTIRHIFEAWELRQHKSRKPVANASSAYQWVKLTSRLNWWRSFAGTRSPSTEIACRSHCFRRLCESDEPLLSESSSWSGSMTSVGERKGSASSTMKVVLMRPSKQGFWDNFRKAFGDGVWSWSGEHREGSHGKGEEKDVKSMLRILVIVRIFTQWKDTKRWEFWSFLESQLAVKVRSWLSRTLREGRNNDSVFLPKTASTKGCANKSQKGKKENIFCNFSTCRENEEVTWLKVILFIQALILPLTPPLSATM